VVARRIQLDDKLYTTAEVARLCDYNSCSVARWARMGRIPTIRRGHRYLIERAVVKQLLREGPPPMEPVPDMTPPAAGAVPVGRP